MKAALFTLFVLLTAQRGFAFALVMFTYALIGALSFAIAKLAYGAIAAEVIHRRMKRFSRTPA